MNFLSSILGGGNPILSLGLSLATGGLGGLAMEAAKMAVSQIAQNAVAQLGFPPALTGMLQSGIQARLGPGLPTNPQTSEGIADVLSDAFGLDLNEVQESVMSLEELMIDLIGKLIKDEEENRKKAKGESAKGGGSQSWIMAMAEKLGEIVDTQFLKWQAQADKVAELQKVAEGDATRKRGGVAGLLGGRKENKAVTNAKQQLPSETVKMSAELQQFNMLMNAANSGIKTAGQAAAALAGRQ